MTRTPRTNLAARPSELPARHLEAFVWRFCDREGFHLALDLDTFRVTCNPEELLSRRQGPDRAVRDRGGTWHLMGSDRSFCLGDFNRSDWCTGQVRGSYEFTLDVPSVPLGDRCERAKGRWPPQLTGNTSIVRVRRSLVAEFGPGCAVCPEPWASKVDHDHLTGAVRGYLCNSCNTALAECRHIAGCRFVKYLQRPPAGPLDLTYPRHAAEVARPAQLARRKCYDRVMSGGVSPGVRALLDTPAAAR